MSRKKHHKEEPPKDPMDLTEDQTTKLSQLREQLQDIIKPDHDDHFLLKWLVARKFDLKKTEDMYRKSMTWRAEIGADTMVDRFKVPDVMKLYYPGGLFGEDRDGRPLWIDPMGNTDLKGLLYSAKKSDVINSIVYSVESLRLQFKVASAKHGRPINQCLHVVDISGFGSNFMWKPALDLYIEIVRILEDNYPEILKRTFIINAPKIFKAAYTVFKTFIDEGTANKFVLLDDDWKEELQKFIDPNQLPVYFGGTQVDPGGDEKCLSRLCYGGKVPESCYKKREDFFPTDVEVCHENVGRNGKHEVRREITKPQSILKWIFATDAGLIYFTVYNEIAAATKDGGKHGGKTKAKREVVKARKDVECHRVPEDGFLVCEHPGTYCLVFENDTIMSSRDLTYLIEVVEGTSETKKSAEAINSLRTVTTL